jgi:hypothetical protein
MNYDDLVVWELKESLIFTGIIWLNWRIEKSNKLIWITHVNIMKMCFRTKLCCDDDKLYEEKENNFFFLKSWYV